MGKSCSTTRICFDNKSIVIYFGNRFVKEQQTPGIHYYEFSSIGPKGSIRKVVQFQQKNVEENIYNLGFGDFCPKTEEISDLAITNNLDTKKVLSTVARAVIDFMTLHPNAIVMAKGSTPARTRLYQMGISEFWDDIKEMFEVKGFVFTEKTQCQKDWVLKSCFKVLLYSANV